jgi:hypothetical protein
MRISEFEAQSQITQIMPRRKSGVSAINGGLGQRVSAFGFLAFDL